MSQVVAGRLARVRTIQTSDARPNATEKVLTEIASKVRVLPGLVEAYWLIDRASGKGISIIITGHTILSIDTYEVLLQIP